MIPRVHGSALFERGETQILGVTTLNMLRMEQQLDTLSPEDGEEFSRHLAELGYAYWEESDNPAYRMFLGPAG